MVDPKKVTRRSALGLVAAGGVLVASETLGYNLIRSDRLSSLMTAGDDSALIALVEAEYDVVPRNAFETVAHLTNNVGDDVNVVFYEVSTNQDGVSISFDGQEGGVGESITGTLDIPEGGDVPVDLECSTPGQIDGPEILFVELSEVNSENTAMSISGLSFDLPFVCTGGPLLRIPAIRGLGNHRSFQDIAAEIDVEETANNETENLEVGLTIEGDSEGIVFDETQQAPGDFPEISNDTITVHFDVTDPEPLPEDSYTFTATANADNATQRTESGTFLVDDELLIIDLAGARTGARNLAVDALNRTGETVTLTAVGVEHDPDGEANQERDTFDELEIVVDGTTEVFLDGGAAGLPGDGGRIDHDPVALADGFDAEYAFDDWAGTGNINGETFEITIWAKDEDGVEIETTDRVTA